MAFILDEELQNITNIKVIGVGGGGGNAVNRMVQMCIRDSYLGVLVGVVLGYTVLALSVPSLLGGWLSGTSVSLFIGVLTAYAFGLVGFVDDYIKVANKRNLGLMARYHIVAQVLILSLIHT